MALDSSSQSPICVWLTFLEAWTEEARARGAKSASAYAKAHHSLSTCTDALVHPCETLRLRGIGESIAQRLEAAYSEWCAEHGCDMPARPSAAVEPRATRRPSRPRKPKAYIPEPRSGAHGLLIALYTRVLDDGADDAQLGKSELIARAQPYCDSDYTVPSGHSQAAPSSLLRRGASQTVPRRSFATAWNSIKTLINKGYVYRNGNPALYSLSAEGLEVARLLAQAEGIQGAASAAQQASDAPRAVAHEVALPESPRLRSPPERASVEVASSPHSPIDLSPLPVHTPKSNVPITISLIDSSPIVLSTSPKPASPAPSLRTLCHTLPPDSYTIHMLVDHREVRSRSMHEGRATFHEALAERGIPCEPRALELGDVVWIAKPRAQLDSASRRAWTHIPEVVLDIVVERKRLDDLTSSLVDGRWHDQKRRLKDSGLGLVFYLIEDMHVSHLVQRYGAQIQTALSSTLVVDNFYVHRTANSQGTLEFLGALHKAVEAMYKGKVLHVLKDESIQRESYAQMQRTLRAEHAGRFHTSFHAFQELHTKTSASGTLGDVWTRMLMCIRGVSPEKAQEITKRWPTPRHLLDAYAQCGAAEAPHFLSNAMDGGTRLARRRIGHALSERIWYTLQSDYASAT